MGLGNRGLFGRCGACLADEAVDGLGRIGTDGEPFIGFLKIDLVVGTFEKWIVGADLLDVTTIATFAGIYGNDFVVWAVFGALAIETERN